MEEPRSATPYLKVFMSHVSCLPVRRSSLPVHAHIPLLRASLCTFGCAMLGADSGDQRQTSDQR